MMKKRLQKLLCFVLCLALLSGCALTQPPAAGGTGRESSTGTEAVANTLPAGTALYQALDDTKLQAIKTAQPREIVVTLDKGGDQQTWQFTDAAELQTLVQAFTAITVGNTTQTVATDRYNRVEFVWADGTTSLVRLCRYDLEYDTDGAGTYYTLQGMDTFLQQAESMAGSRVTIVPTEASQIEFETYADSNMTMEIPKGWTVSVLDGVTPEYYTFMVYNPQDDRYKFFFNMKNEGAMASEEDRAFMQMYYPDSAFARLPALVQHDCEGFYNIFNVMVENNTETFHFPIVNDFTVIENLGTNVTGGEILWASCLDDDGNALDGIFTASVKLVSLYYATATSVYTTMFYTAPETMLVEWEPVFNTMLASFVFTDAFMEQYYTIQDINLRGAMARADIYAQISDTIVQGWYDRQSTYEILSQKQSDATLGYDRVYDTDTGEIYRVESGFMDSYDGSSYAPVTDDMYNLPLDGYIE